MLSYLSEILQNNQYALLTVFMFHMVRTDKGSDVEKVLLVYSVAGIFVFLGDFNPQSVFLAALCVLFLWFEFFCFDTWRVRNFNFVGKTVDFFIPLSFHSWRLLLHSFYECWMAPFSMSNTTKR